MKISFCLSITLLLMLFAYLKKSITPKGIITAGLITFGASYYGGYAFLMMIILVFFVDLLFHMITGSRSDLRRNERQIIANLFLPFLCIIIYAMNHKAIFLALASLCFAECLSDSLASVIGVHAKHHFNIKSFKFDGKDLSGDVSLLGILASIYGALIISFTYYELFTPNYYQFLMIALLASVGAFIDSILGAFVQAKYKCSKCKKIVEEPTHCNRKAKKVSGCFFITNSTVNFLSELIVLVIGYFIL